MTSNYAASRRLWPYLVIPGAAVLVAAAIFLVDMGADEGGTGGSSEESLPGSQADDVTDSTLQPSEEDQRLAAQAQLQETLDERIEAYLSDLGDEDFYASVAVDDGEFQLDYEGDEQHDTASVVKVEILAMLLDEYDSLDDVPDWLLERAGMMIRDSDNDATNDILYGGAFDDGREALAEAHTEFGLDDTNANETGQWGMTRTTALDQLRMLELALYEGGGVLDEEQVEFVRSLMGDLSDFQEWGVSAAAADGETVWMKNGWDTRDALDGEWVVNSIGVIAGDTDEPIEIAILTGGSASEEEGVDRVEDIAKIVREVVDTDPYA